MEKLDIVYAVIAAAGLLLSIIKTATKMRSPAAESHYLLAKVAVIFLLVFFSWGLLAFHLGCMSVFICWAAWYFEWVGECQSIPKKDQVVGWVRKHPFAKAKYIYATRKVLLPGFFSVSHFTSGLVVQHVHEYCHSVGIVKPVDVKTVFKAESDDDMDDFYREIWSAVAALYKRIPDTRRDQLDNLYQLGPDYPHGVVQEVAYDPGRVIVPRSEPKQVA